MGFPHNYFMATDHSIAALIDHTLLKPEATAADVRKVCEEARKYGLCQRLRQFLPGPRRSSRIGRHSPFPRCM